MALFDNAVAASRDSERVLSVLERAVAGVRGMSGRRGEATTVVGALVAVALQATSDARKETVELGAQAPLDGEEFREYA